MAFGKEDFIRDMHNGLATADAPETHLQTIQGTIRQAMEVLCHLDALADRLAGSAQTKAAGSSGDRAIRSDDGVIPQLASEARDLQNALDRANESIRRIERLI